MIKKLALYTFGAAVLLNLAACNEGPIETEQEYIYSSTLVNSFSLKANNKILNNLDSVFFSINLVDGTIFNADSLPYGTKVDRLQVSLTTDACSTIELLVPKADGTNEVINYATNPNDSIDFSSGSVKLHLVSFDEKAERDYVIRVNVHKVVPDSLSWSRIERRNLPTALNGILKRQKSVRCGNYAVCLTTDGEDYSIALTTNPADFNSWTSANTDFGFTPAVSSLSATDDALFILSDDNLLYRSDDLGQTWTSTGLTWTHIYGNYGSRLLGVRNDGTAYRHVTYPATTESDVPAGCPVKGTSTLASIDSKWSDTPQVLMAGGILADGSTTNAIWGYDGRTWACVSNALPEPLSDACLIPYTISKTDTVSWRVTDYHVLLAMLGTTRNGETSNRVYISRDNGINWKLGDDLVQLPSYIPSMTGAQALIFNTTMTVNPSSRAARSGWQAYTETALPRWVRAELPLTRSQRAVKPVESWEAPYIYLFGGYDRVGTLYDTIWRGILNRLTFVPLI